MTTWFLIAAAAVVLSAISLYFTYYGPIKSEVWVERFRKVDNVDHVGMLLEWLFIVICSAVLLVFSGVIYPETSRQFLDHHVFNWFPFAAAAATIWVVSYILSRTRKNLREEIKAARPGYFAMSETSSRFKAGLAGMVRKYRYAYLWQSIVFALILLVLGSLIWLGAAGDLRSLHETRSGLCDQDLAGSNQRLDGGVLRRAEHLYASYLDYEAALLEAVNRFLGVLACVLIILSWFLATQFQSVFADVVVDLFRYICLLVLLLFLPGLLFLGYGELVEASEEVSGSFAAVPLDPPADLASEDHLGNLRHFNELRSEATGRASASGFWPRLVGGWGGLALILWGLLAFLQSRLAHWSILSNLVPTRTPAIFRVMFRRPKHLGGRLGKGDPPKN